jgi:hypothetical protein
MNPAEIVELALLRVAATLERHDWEDERKIGRALRRVSEEIASILAGHKAVTDEQASSDK